MLRLPSLGSNSRCWTQTERHRSWLEICLCSWITVSVVSEVDVETLREAHTARKLPGEIARQNHWSQGSIPEHELHCWHCWHCYCYSLCSLNVRATAVSRSTVHFHQLGSGYCCCPDAAIVDTDLQMLEHFLSWPQLVVIVRRASSS